MSSAQLLGLPEGGKDRGQGPGEGWHSIRTVSLWQVVPAESSFWPGITNPLFAISCRCPCVLEMQLLKKLFAPYAEETLGS